MTARTDGRAGGVRGYLEFSENFLVQTVRAAHSERESTTCQVSMATHQRNKHDDVRSDNDDTSKPSRSFFLYPPPRMHGRILFKNTNGPTAHSFDTHRVLCST